MKREIKVLNADKIVDVNGNIFEKINVFERMILVKDKLKCKVKRFLKNEDGIGVVEIILITIVLIALVLIFKKQVSDVVKSILEKMSTNANKV